MLLEMGQGQNVGLRDVCHYDFVATGGIRVSQTHVLFLPKQSVNMAEQQKRCNDRLCTWLSANLGSIPISCHVLLSKRSSVGKVR